MTELLRFFDPKNGVRLGCCLSGTVYDVTESFASLASWLKASAWRPQVAIQELVELAARSRAGFPLTDLDHDPDPEAVHLLAPVDLQEVWAAGVTYQRSQEARQQEAVDGGDIYARVYSSRRPELFFKAAGPSVVGPRQSVGIRADAAWSVPEPELALLINPALEVVGMTVGNDMSSRDIEGANPLYLPQAKIYTASCALGPSFVLGSLSEWPRAGIQLAIHRKGQAVFEGSTHTGMIRRRVDELVEYLGRSTAFPNGVVLLTGTGIVPPQEFTLQAGDVVTITIEGVGVLTNPVRVV